LGYSFVITQISQHPERFNTFETNRGEETISSESIPEKLNNTLKQSGDGGLNYNSVVDLHMFHEAPG